MKGSVPTPSASSAEIESQLRFIESLAETVKRLDLSEIEVSQGDLKIRVARQISAMIAGPIGPAPNVGQAPPPSSPVVASASANGAAIGDVVKSPMVGTVYLRPAPEASLFVSVGARVNAGDKILLVEAMKTFNEIIAPRAGAITAILVQHGQPVEYDQPLFAIE
jgi:acetyl-CoA carboxylase biotin carboxyl carrier protein